MSLQVVSITDLGGGLNVHNGKDGISPSEMVSGSRNVRGEAEFSTARNGYVPFANELTGSMGGVRVLAPYLRKSAGNDRLLAVYNENVYTIDPSVTSTWTNINSTLLTDDTNVNTVSYYDWAFLFNGVDKPLRLENTTLSQPFVKPDSIADADDFTPSLGAVYTDSLFVAGVPESPNSLFISKASTAADPQNIYDFSGTLYASAVDANEKSFNSRITALRNLSTALVVFLEDGAYYIPGLKEFAGDVLYDTQPIGGASGAVSQKTTCVVENDIYYLTPQKEIRSIKRGFSDQLSMITTSLSTKIQPEIDALVDDDLSSAFSYYDSKAKKYYLYLKRKGDIFNTLRIVGDLDRLDESGTPAWYIDDNMSFQSGCAFNGKVYIGSSVSGQTFEDNVGRSDNGAAIRTRRVSKDLNGNTSSGLKTYRDLHIYGQITEGTELIFRVYVNNILINESTVNVSNTTGAYSASGIGTQSVGDFEIGDETEDTTPYIDDYYQFTKRIQLRSRGQVMRFEIITDGTNNGYKISTADYFFIPNSRKLYPKFQV